MGRKGLDIHLFVEYVNICGDSREHGVFVGTVFGKEYVVHSKDTVSGLPLQPEPWKYLNTIVASLVNSCNMENIRISVTVFNEREIATIQRTTNSPVILNNCAENSTFCWGNNGGKIHAAYGIDSVQGCEKLREHVLKLKTGAQDRRHVVLFVSEIFPACATEKGKKEIRDFFNKWKMDGVEFITLRLDNSDLEPNAATPRWEKRSFSNDLLYQGLSTVPEWTQKGDYDKICFVISLIGKKLSSMDYAKQYQGLRQLVIGNSDYQLKNEVAIYDQGVKDKIEKILHRREEEHALYMDILEREKKKKVPLAYLSVFFAVVAIILYLSRRESCLFFSIISLVCGYLGKESSKRNLSICGFVLGIIILILTGGVIIFG